MKTEEKSISFYSILQGLSKYSLDDGQDYEYNVCDNFIIIV